jgi:hypothetical protein
MTLWCVVSDGDKPRPVILRRADAEGPVDSKPAPVVYGSFAALRRLRMTAFIKGLRSNEC